MGSRQAGGARPCAFPASPPALVTPAPSPTSSRAPAAPAAPAAQWELTPRRQQADSATAVGSPSPWTPTQLRDPALVAWMSVPRPRSPSSGPTLPVTASLCPKNGFLPAWHFPTQTPRASSLSAEFCPQGNLRRLHVCPTAAAPRAPQRFGGSAAPRHGAWRPLPRPALRSGAGVSDLQSLLATVANSNPKLPGWLQPPAEVGAGAHLGGNRPSLWLCCTTSGLCCVRTSAVFLGAASVEVFLFFGSIANGPTGVSGAPARQKQSSVPAWGAASARPRDLLQRKSFRARRGVCAALRGTGK